MISARPLLDTDLWALIQLGATQIHAAFKLRNYSLVLSPPSFPDTFSPLVSHPQLPAPAFTSPLLCRRPTSDRFSAGSGEEAVTERSMALGWGSI